MKIMHILTDSNVGGAGILLESLLRHTAVARESIFVLLPRGAALCDRFRACGVTVLPLLRDGDRSLSLRDFFIIRRTLCRIKPDILHTHASLSGKLAARSLLFSRPVVLSTRHCAYPVSEKERSPLLCLFRRTGDRLLSATTVVTAEAAAENLTALGIPQSRICLIRNGAEALRRLSPSERDTLREALGIPREAFVIGMCARLEPVKDHMTMLRAAVLLLSGHTGYHFLWIGDGSEAAELHMTAEKWGLLPHLTMIGYAADVAPYVNLFDVAVNCSVGTETSCLALSEAMSLGIPCVVSRYGGNPELIREGENGLLFPPRDAHALARALSRLSHDRALYLALSHGAEKRYRTALRAPRMAEAYDRLYTRLLSRRTHLRTAILEDSVGDGRQF